MSGAYSGGGVIAAALSFGLALMVFAASFGHIQGVHSNSVVPIGVLIADEMQLSRWCNILDPLRCIQRNRS